jgi:hypothetical protein
MSGSAGPVGSAQAASARPLRSTPARKKSKPIGRIVFAIVFAALCAVGVFGIAAFVSRFFTGAELRFGSLPFIIVVAASALVGFFVGFGKKILLIIILFLVSGAGIWIHFLKGDVTAEKYIRHYVPESLLNLVASEPSSPTITQDVNFRDAPGTNSNIIRALNAGEEVTIIGEAQNGWLPIEHNGESGWVSSEYVSR